MNKADQNSSASKPAFSGERVRLGDLISPSKVIRCGSNSYPVLSMTMHDGIVMQAGRFKKAIASKDTSAYKVVMPGQLVVGFPIDEGVIYVQNFDEPGIMSPAYNVWNINQTLVCPEYLELALHSPQSMAYYSKKMRGTTARRRSITPANLCALEIPLPPIGDQSAIVDAFRRIKSIERENTALIANLQTLVKSRFIEMFGDGKLDCRPLSECVNSIDSGKSPNCGNSPRSDRDPAVLKLSAISSGIYLEKENKRLLPGESVTDGREVTQGDILLARKNTPELVGKSAYVSKTEGNIMFPDIVFRMHPCPTVDGIYLAHVLSGPMFSEIKNLAHGSAKSMSNIPKSELAKLQVPLPPLALQQEFAAFARQAAKLEFVAQRQFCRFSSVQYPIRTARSVEASRHRP